MSLSSLAGLPNSITNIDTWAFASCSNLLSLTGIPSSLISIGTKAFGNPYDKNYYPSFVRANDRYEGGVVVLPPTLKKVGTNAFGSEPHICERIIFDIRGAKLEWFNWGSFSGGAPYVQTSMTLDEIEKAYSKSSAAVTGSDLLATDGIFARVHDIPGVTAATFFSQYVAKSYFDLALAIRMPSLPNWQTAMCDGFGSGVKYCWGDGDVSSGSDTHRYDYSKDAVFYVNDGIVSIPAKTTNNTWPVVRTESGGNQYAQYVIVGPLISAIGANAFRGMPNCGDVRINSSSLTFGSNVFEGLGTSLSLKTISGTSIKYKAIVYVENFDCQSILDKGAPFGAPTTTVFSCIDGYVYYNGSKWTMHTNEISATFKWAERGPDDVSTSYSYSYYVKFPSYYTEPNGVTYLCPLSYCIPNNVLNEVGIRNQYGVKNTVTTLIGISEQQYSRLYQLGYGAYISYSKTSSTTDIGNDRSTVWVGNFTFSNNGYGYVSVDGGKKTQIKSGQNIVIGGRNGNTIGYVSHSIKIYGRVERIDVFIGQNDPPVGLPPVVTALNLSKCSSLKSIMTFANVQVSPASAGIPNSVEEFGAHCFENRTDSISNLNWLPTSLKGIPDFCFNGCKNLTSLYGIERCTQLTTLGYWCFRDCTSLAGTLAQQKANNGCLPSSVNTISSAPFMNVCYGAANSEFAVCMRGKTLAQILSFDNVRWSASQAEVDLNGGSVGRLKWYGTDGYIQDVVDQYTSAWQQVKQNTGL